MNHIIPKTNRPFSIGYNTDRIAASDLRLLDLVDMIFRRYHFRADPIRIGNTDLLVTITRSVPGSPTGLEDEFLKMALASGFKETEVFVSVLPDLTTGSNRPCPILPRLYITGRLPL